MTKYLFGKTENKRFWVSQILESGEVEPWREYPASMKNKLAIEYKELEPNCTIDYELNLTSGWKIKGKRR